MKQITAAGHFILGIFLGTVARFNPLRKPITPALFTLHLLAVVLTLLWLRDRILCTFITGYGEIAISAWGFLLLMNFLEAFAEAIQGPGDESEDNDEGPDL